LTTHPPLVRHKVALVIGSGALRCAAAYGVVDVLRREKIPVDMVVACSGGAFCGVWLADGAPGDGEAESRRFAQGWQGSFDRRSWRSIAKALFPKAFGFDPALGLVHDARINRAVSDYVGERRFEDLRLPLHLVATDFDTGEQVVLSRGRLFDAIRASIAIPMVLPPWSVEGRRLVDGALCDPLPVDIAVREGADVIIAVGFEESLQPRGSIRSGMDMVLQLKTVLVNHLFRSQYAFYSLSHHAEVVPVLPDFQAAIGLRDHLLVPHIVQRGREAAEREVPYLRRLLLEAPNPVPHA
jgi:NTE family protein